MKRTAWDIPATGSLSRGNRAPAALDTGYFHLDERSLADLINSASHLAGILTYFDEQNQPHAPEPGSPGPWASFFQHDVTFLLAEIASTAAASEYRQSREDGRDLGEMTMDHICRLGLWHRRAAEMATFAPEGSVESDLLKYLDTLEKSELSGPVLAQLRPPLGGADPDTSVGLALLGKKSAPARRAMFNAINLATDQLATHAQRLLLRALSERQNHGAHLGLFLAFVRLLQKSQADLNRMTDRHLEFYFRDVLRSVPRAARPDTAHVTFDLAPGASFAELEEGTTLIAGSGSGPDAIVFETDRALRVNSARVQALTSISVKRDTVQRDRSGARYVNSVNIFPMANSADGHGAPLADAAAGWPPFGPDLDAPPDFGFVVAAPILWLASGERRLRLSLRFDAQSSFTLAKALKDYRTALERNYSGRLNAASQGESNLTDARFHAFLAEAVQVSLSTANGFHRVSDLRVLPDPDHPDRLDFILGLPASAPPIVPFVRLHEWPLLKVALNPKARAYAYSPFYKLRLIGARLDVAVSGITELKLATDIAPVAPGTPFAPFGPTQLPGARLFITADELSIKAPSRLDLDMRWSGLPVAPQDLTSHYAGYGGEIANHSFRATLAISDGTDWRKVPVIGPDQTHPHADAALFTTDAKGLTAETQWQMPQLAPAHLPLDNAARLRPPGPKGTLMMALSAPDMGFGQRAYPGLVTQSALARSDGVIQKLLGAITSRVAPGEAAVKPLLPNPPIVPILAGLSLSYEASESVDAIAPDLPIQMYNLHLLGNMDPLADGCLFRADLNVDGYLMIGLDRVDLPETVSLFFDIQSSRASGWRPGDPEAKPGITWSYLSDTGWRVLPEAAIRADDTEGLTTHGVVEIALPQNARPTNRFSKSALIWISVAMRGTPTRYGRIVDIKTQAVKVTRRLNAGRSGADTMLPAGSIKRFLSARPAVASITQPLPSQGGRPEETTETHRLRLAERLGHKNRALRPVEYARMILAEFDDIGDVKCRFGLPGRLEVIVAPRRDPGTHDRFPRVALFKREQIARWLAARSPLSVEQIDMRSPAYEEIRVQAHILLSQTGSAPSMMQIERHISHQIAPWMFDPGIPLPIGRSRIDVSTLSESLRSQPGIDAVLGFSLVHFFRRRSKTLNDNGPYGFKDSARAKASDHIAPSTILSAATPASVFVPALQHNISFLTERAGIGDLVVGSDFIAIEPALLQRYRADPAALPLYPVPAGIGNLRIGTDLILTDPEDTVPPSSITEAGLHPLDAVLLAE